MPRKARTAPLARHFDRQPEAFGAVFKAGSTRAAMPPEGLATAAFLAALLVFAWALLFRLHAENTVLICRADDAGFVALASMWAAMTVAMMIPSGLPAILAYSSRVSRCEPEGLPLVLAGVFAAAYLAVWVLFGMVAATAQWGLAAAGVMRDGFFLDQRLDGMLLVLAGLYQWSAAKAACLVRCQAPAASRLRHPEAGIAGAARLGVAHGAACVGCCWLLMLLAFVGGTMHLAWMGALTLFVALERLAGARETMLRLSGAGLLAAGVTFVLAP